MKLLHPLLIIVLASSLAAADGKRHIQAVAVSEHPKIDGRLNEPFYSGILSSGDFVQFHPANGDPATLATDVYLFFDSHNLYIAFRCHDLDPGKIKADLTPFAGYENNDEVTVMLDPFSDRRNHVTFAVNARGIRSGEDTIWKAATAIDATGWCVEIEIPFKSLRFPTGDIEAWGVNFSRRIFRLNETDYWAPVTRKQTRTLAATFGTLAGLSGIRGGKNLELFPYAGLRNSKSADLQENRLAYGLDLKYGITSNLTLDLTTSPDYSDIESDPFFYQTNPYEYRLSENRPFFMESASFFSTAFNLFYSRRIDHPNLALKITGRENGYSLGALLAKNDNPEGDRFHGVLRIKKDILRLSNIGIIYSAIEGAGNWNRNAGFDFQFRIRDTYTFSGFVAFTFNRQTPQKQNGMFRLLFSKKKERGFSWAGIFDRIEPNVNALAGYIPTNDYQKIWLLPRYYFLWEGRFLEQLQLTLSLGRYNSIRKEEVTSIGGELIVRATFRNQMEAMASYLLARDRPKILDEQGNLQWHREMNPFLGPAFSWSYRGHRLFQTGITVYSRVAVVYTKDFRQVKRGKASGLWIWMNLKLSPNLQWEWQIEHIGQAATDGSVDFRGNLFSTSLRWQVSRTISTFAKFQYDSSARRFGYDFLLLFEPAPVSRMVVSLKNLCEERFRLFQPQARTLVMKFSYLIRI